MKRILLLLLLAASAALAAGRQRNIIFIIANDPHETTDVAGQHPDVVRKHLRLANSQHTKSALWPVRGLDGASD